MLPEGNIPFLPAERKGIIIRIIVIVTVRYGTVTKIKDIVLKGTGRLWKS